MASAHGPDTEGAGIRVCGYAIKNSGLIVEGTKEPSCLCEITPSQDPKSSGRRRVPRIVTVVYERSVRSRPLVVWKIPGSVLGVTSFADADWFWRRCNLCPRMVPASVLGSKV